MAFPRDPDNTLEALTKKERARGKTHYAIKTGKLIRPTSCDRCEQQSEKIHAHHDDYNSPLAVTWLCVSCHSLTHNALRDEKVRKSYA